MWGSSALLSSNPSKAAHVRVQLIVSAPTDRRRAAAESNKWNTQCSSPRLRAFFSSASHEPRYVHNASAKKNFPICRVLSGCTIEQTCDDIPDCPDDNRSEVAPPDCSEFSRFLSEMHLATYPVGLIAIRDFRGSQRGFFRWSTEAKSSRMIGNVLPIRSGEVFVGTDRERLEVTCR